jgi:arsenite-transporting ATPase
VIFDTAPTGHTLRLLELPAAWSASSTPTSAARRAWGRWPGSTPSRPSTRPRTGRPRDPAQTTWCWWPGPSAPRSGGRAHPRELAQLGVGNLRLVLNGVFRADASRDPIALAMEDRAAQALAAMPPALGQLPRVEVPLLPIGLVGIAALRQLGAAGARRQAPDAVAAEGADLAGAAPPEAAQRATLDALVAEIAARGHGVIMTMGKGGVGKTTVAARVAIALAQRGLPVTLTTTDPAAHVAAAAAALGGAATGLHVERIDPTRETQRYTEEVVAAAGAGLDEAGLALLREDLRSPCTEEIAVFRAFAETVAQGAARFVVIDTAPTGHTLLLLDAAEAYHREVLKRPSGSPEAVQRLLPRLRDPAYTHVLLVTLPEATPIHEAMQLERDLARAEIRPMAWVVNQSLTPLVVRDAVLRARRAAEAAHLRELDAHASRIVLEPWSAVLGVPGVAPPPPVIAGTPARGSVAP